MRPLHVTLLATLGLNAVLAGFWLSGRARLADEAAMLAKAEARARAAAQAIRAQAEPAIDPKTWASLDTPDLPDLVARLRAAGFPADLVRAIIRATVAEQFAAKRRALDPEGAKRAYWKNVVLNPAIQLAQNKLYREQEKLNRELLGADAEGTDPMTLVAQRLRYGNLPPEKLAAIWAATVANSEKTSDLYAKNGAVTPEENRALQAELRTSLAALLTPAELEEYDMRSGNTGRILRNELLAFDPTEEEFRTLFRLRQPFDQKYNYALFLGPEEQQRRSEEAQQLKEQIMAALGPTRGEEYTRSLDYNYRQTAQLVSRLALPPETTLTLWNLQKDYNERAAAIYRSTPRATTPEATEAYQQQFVALKAEASARVGTVLTDPAHLKAYEQYGGDWLVRLVPPKK